MKIDLQTTALVALLVLGGAVPVLAQEAPPGAQLEELLTLARQANPDLAARRFEADANAAKVLPAGALPDPRLRVELMDITRQGAQNPTLWPSDVGQTKYTLIQTLPWFGKLGLKQDMTEQLAQASQSNVQITWLDIAGRIKVLQAQRYFLHQSIKLNSELVELVTPLEQVAQVRYAGGLSPQQDAIRAQVELTRLQTELAAFNGAYAQANARLNALLARPAQLALAAPQPLKGLSEASKLDAATLAERVQRNNPQLFAEQARIRAAELSKDLTFKNRYPDFTLALVPTQRQNSIAEWGLMLELNIPLQQGTRRAQEAQALAELEAVRARQAALANKLLGDLSDNLAALSAAQDTEKLVANSLLPQAQLTFQAALAGYENGKLNFATLMDAQRQLSQARQSQLKAQLDAQVRLADIEKLLGETL